MAQQLEISPITHTHRLRSPHKWRSALLAQLTLPLRPEITARQTEHVGLGIAYVSHLVTVILGIPAFFLYVVSLAYLTESHYNPTPQWSSYEAAWREFFAEIEQGWGHGEMAIWFLVSELGPTLLAVILLPCTGRHEPVTLSFARACRCIWLSTSLIYIWASYVFTTVAAVQALRFSVYQDDWMRFPFLLQHDYVFQWSMLLAGCWALQVWIRAVAAGSDASHPRFTMCESCGYNLSHTPVESRCPECGEPAFESLAAPRQPTRWEATDSQSSMTLFAICVHEVFLHPVQFFHAMPAHSGHTAARRCMFISLIMAALLTMPAFLTFESETGGHGAGDPDWYWRLICDLTLVPFAGFGILFAATGLLAALVGWYQSWTHGRPLLVPCAKLCFYMTSYYLLWAPAFFLTWTALHTMVVALWPHGGFLAESPYSLSIDEQAAIFNFVLHALVGLGYLLLVRRGIRAVRFANN